MKKLLIIALALMLALSLVACGDKNGNENESNNEIILNPNGTGDNGAGTGDPSTGNNGNGGNTNTPPVEEVFTDLEQTIFIVADVASVRSEARIADETLIDYTTKDTEFKSVAYSANWFKIEYEVEVEETTEAATDAAAPASEEATTEADATTEAETEAAPKTETVVAYVHKSVACVKDLTAADLEEPLTLYVIAGALYVRSYYDFAAQDNMMCTLQQGDEVTAVAKGNGWYKIQLSDDAQGNPVFGYISSNEKYVSTTKPEETTVAEEQTTEAAQ
ncbi:MAG: SH3 domain-containing protein [Clostridia bacterium]|nr:SH3 domain-containing protein [Clostridia bacterium]MBO7296568.1 SH3 domain-containing protein [Clostridia bacterium]